MKNFDNFWIDMAMAGTYLAVGIIAFTIIFIILDKVTPRSIWTEILEEHNNALAIVVGAIAIALGIIIGSAISG